MHVMSPLRLYREHLETSTYIVLTHKRIALCEYKTGGTSERMRDCLVFQSELISCRLRFRAKESTGEGCKE